VVYARFFRKLPFILLIAVPLTAVASCSSKEGSNMDPVTGGGVGGADMPTGGTSGAGATGGTGGMTAGAAGDVGGAGGVMSMMAGMGGGGGEAGAAGIGGAGGDMPGGMGGEGGSGGTPGGVEPNPDGTDPLPPLPEAMTLPIVFVHGFAGSAQQYESQAQRFVANGYPQERIVAYDHDGSGFDTGAYANGVDEVVDKALADFGTDKVFLVGHSRGTFVGSDYLGNATRAAKVSKYISLDGSGCLGIPVPCLEPSQSSIPGQAHVEIATSRESFEAQYEFLLGSAPMVVDIVPQKAPVVLNGRAVNFPANTGRTNTTVELWEIDAETGYRATDMPLATMTLDAEGNWGPVTVDSRKRYEFALVPTGEGSTHHIYMQNFLRDSNFVRLLSGDATSATRMNTHTSDMHSTIVAMRMREWYATDNGQTAGDQTDTIEISTSRPSGDVMAVNALQRYIGNATIGIHIHDAEASPGDSTLTALPYFSGQAFQNGVDVFMPAADPPDGTITFKNIPRGDTAKPQVVNIPNWVSAKHAITVMLSDYAQ
jgi:pimeloyl-ACP methyl ester carboxylesterase